MGKTYSRLLVFFQFLFLSMLFLPYESVHTQVGTLVAIVVFSCALILFAWILIHNKSGNFNIVPEPKEKSVLVCTGPYRFVRHPMYSGVMLVAVGALALQFAWWKLGIGAALAIVLYLKAVREEGFWQGRDSRYCHYLEGTKMFIPCVF